MELSEALREENRRLRRLRLVVDLTLARLYQDPDLSLLEAIGSATNVPLIASGGAGTLDHLVEALAPGRADAVLAASIFHFGEYRIADAKRHLARNRLPVRP